MPREAHRVDFSLHSFADSSALSVENISMSGGNHALLYSDRFGVTLITIAELVSIHNYVET